MDNPISTTPAPFNNATFVYDGDGKRVKSIFNGTTTTYFVGNHYEVTGSTITKYYYAGSQRIAMRTNGTLNYLLGDHLGSTSLTTNASGQIISELRYKAWGEERYASGTTPTDYTYTGQYSYTDDFGLMFYNARWYDPSLGRFTSADTIIPGPENSQAWDRYAYTLNNPLRYTDPSGHCPICIGLVLVGGFFIFNGTSDSYQPNLSAAELESRQTSVELGTALIVTSYSIQAPIVEALSNTYDCATGYCDPSLMLPGSAAPYREALEDGVPGSTTSSLYALGNTSGPRPPRVEGYNLKLGQDPDISIDANGLVIPGQGGASTYETIEQLNNQGLNGHVWELPGGSSISGFDDIPDGIPFGSQPPGHHSLTPNLPMLPSDMIDNFNRMPWRPVIGPNNKHLKLPLPQ